MRHALQISEPPPRSPNGVLYRPTLRLCSACSVAGSLALLLAMAACAPGATSEGAEAWAEASEVVAAVAGDGMFEDPERAVNGVRGGGSAQGSLDVFSLDYEDNSSLVLGWSGATVVNTEGPELVVFENAFSYGEPEPRIFMDLLIVSVSPDGERWVDFPHDYIAADELSYSAEPAHWEGFAGRSPTLLHLENNHVDPFDQALAGGDAFDLDALPVEDPVAQTVLEEGFRFVRLTTAPSLDNPDTGAPYPRDPISDGADVDGVVARTLR